MNSTNQRQIIGLCLVVGVAGCVTTNQSAGMMDPYDPRNNSPLLQAATRTSGANVPQKETRATSTNTSGTTSSSASQKLRDIKALRDEGILTQKEYEAKKAEILKSM